MNLKQFFKEISIYGMLPLIGKFIGFFLVPIYIRIFSSYEYGIVELVITLIQFLMFGCNMEIYSAIGRFFYGKPDIKGKKALISTGLYLTLTFSLITLIVVLLLKEFIITHYFKGGDYYQLLKVGLVWMLLSASHTYLGVIPRYDKKPKLYVIVTTVSILSRVLSTIFFVVYLRIGIIGILYGHIVGSLISLILYLIITKKYIGLVFSFKDAGKIMKFALPIVPGLLLVGFWQPWSRTLIANYFSIEKIGIFSFALRITSMLLMFSQAIRMAWRPLLFESFNSEDFLQRRNKISLALGGMLFSALAIFILVTPEIVKFIGTQEYYSSYKLIGFLALNGVLQVLTQIRGFGPLTRNRTYFITVSEIVSIGTSFLFFVLIKDRLGLAGIGMVFLLSGIIKFVLLTTYTKHFYKTKIIHNNEIFTLLFIALSIITLQFTDNIIIRTIYLLLFIVNIFLFNKDTAIKLFNNNYIKKISSRKG